MSLNIISIKVSIIDLLLILKFRCWRFHIKKINEFWWVISGSNRHSSWFQTSPLSSAVSQLFSVLLFAPKNFEVEFKYKCKFSVYKRITLTVSHSIMSPKWSGKQIFEPVFYREIWNGKEIVRVIGYQWTSSVKSTLVLLCSIKCYFLIQTN